MQIVIRGRDLSILKFPDGARVPSDRDWMREKVRKQPRDAHGRFAGATPRKVHPRASAPFARFFVLARPMR